MANEITVINSYPCNTGDLALLEATLLGINMFSLSKNGVNVFCNPIGTKYVNYPNVTCGLDLEYRIFDYRKNTLSGVRLLLKRIVRKLLGTKLTIKHNLLASFGQTQYYDAIRSSKIVISSAGSYFTDIYDISLRAAVIAFIQKRIEKKVVFFSQSIGPFTKTKSKKIMEDLFSDSAYIILRENFSRQFVTSQTRNVFVEQDVCFLLKEKYPISKKKTGSLKNIAISIREWKFLGEDKLVAFLKFLIQDCSLNLTSLSTCQGVEDYTNDSFYLKNLQKKYSVLSEIKIDSSYNTPGQLIVKYGDFDAYVGMRLHGAILALIAGTPAFCIGYEHKSKGIFASLELSEYEVSSSSEVEEWITKFKSFENNYPSYLLSVDEIVNNAKEKSKSNFIHLKEILEKQT